MKSKRLTGKPKVLPASSQAAVFKFCSASGGAAILRKNCIFVTSPLDLNDPFEMRPAWTDRHQQRYDRNQLKRNELASGMPALAAMKGGKLAPIGRLPSLTAPQKMNVADQRGIADQHNRQAFELLHNRYRILSLCTEILDLSGECDERDEEHTLMWSHYADMFQGVCLAIDPTRINNGVKDGGYFVKYDKGRRGLPPSFYDTFLSLDKDRVEMDGVPFSSDGESGLLLMDHNHVEKLERHFLEFLHYKSPAWEYEREVRFIYDVDKLRKSTDYRKCEFTCDHCKIAKKPVEECDHSMYRDAVHVPPEAIQAVIFGTDASMAAVDEIMGILSAARYAKVSLFWSSLHSERYIVQYNRRDRDYVKMIQKLRTEHVAYAKGHVRHDKSGSTLSPAAKGVNFTMKKSADQK